MDKVISLFKSTTFKNRPLQTIINLLYLIFCIIFSINTKIKINVGDINLIYKIFNIRIKNFGGKGLLIYREWIEDLFFLAPRILGQKKNIIIDAGANFGMYSILFAKLNLNNQVYSVEPFKEYNKIILHNSKLNNLKNIKIINKVLSNKIARYKLNKNLGNTSASITRKFNKSGHVGVKSITIDKLVKTNKIKKIDFIKLDVEGAELMALQGGKKSIKNFKPKIALECSSKKEFYEINEFLLKFNYKPFSFDKKKNEFVLQTSFSKFYKNLFFFNKKHRYLIKHNK